MAQVEHKAPGWAAQNLLDDQFVHFHDGRLALPLRDVNRAGNSVKPAALRKRALEQPQNTRTTRKGIAPKDRRIHEDKEADISVRCPLVQGHAARAPFAE